MGTYRQCSWVIRESMFMLYVCKTSWATWQWRRTPWASSMVSAPLTTGQCMSPALTGKSFSSSLAWSCCCFWNTKISLLHVPVGFCTLWLQTTQRKCSIKACQSWWRPHENWRSFLISGCSGCGGSMLVYIRYKLPGKRVFLWMRCFGECLTGFNNSDILIIIDLPGGGQVWRAHISPSHWVVWRPEMEHEHRWNRESCPSEKQSFEHQR